jgi:hypothetical protein
MRVELELVHPVAAVAVPVRLVVTEMVQAMLVAVLVYLLLLVELLLTMQAGEEQAYIQEDLQARAVLAEEVVAAVLEPMVQVELQILEAAAVLEVQVEAMVVQVALEL